MLQKKRQFGSIFISNLNPESKEKILSYILSKEKMKEFILQERRENAKKITDLREITENSESEIFPILNSLFMHSQYLIVM
jgi:hypothetical protein